MVADIIYIVNNIL